MTTAMAGEEEQNKETRLKGLTTPKRPKRMERRLIGSSSTWTKEELQRFDVRRGDSVMEPKNLIPEKWFDFGKLENYQSSIPLFPTG
jgi:hypothetical protein